MDIKEKRAQIQRGEENISCCEWDEFSSVPLHMFGLQPAIQLCWVPEGSILLRSLRRPESSHSAGLVMISSKRLSRPLSCKTSSATGSVGKERNGEGVNR